MASIWQDITFGQRRLAILTGALALVAACADATSAQVRPPNIVMIVGDDMGDADIGARLQGHSYTQHRCAGACRHSVHRRVRRGSALQPERARSAATTLPAA